MNDSIIHAPQMQVWNNAAFDDDEDGKFGSINVKNKNCSWWNQSLESASSKENQNPGSENPSLNFVPSSVPKKPLHSHNTTVNSQQKERLKGGPKLPKNAMDRDCDRDEGVIDLEIEEIEREIGRLNSRLEKLKLEKLEIKLTNVEKKRGGGRVVPAKFMDEKKAMKDVGSGARFDRRGASLGPAEIWSNAAKSRIMSTPVSTQQNRRKSCFWKLEGVDELKVIKERGRKSMSVSPKSRRPISKILKQAATTAGIKKMEKKECSVLATIQPKTLFKDGEKSAPNRKVKPGRAVASRYNQIGGSNKNNSNVNSSLSSNGSLSEVRKRSLPDSDKEDVNKRRASRGNGSTRLNKKKWEINPSAVVVIAAESNEEEESPPSASGIADILPRIRTIRWVGETPRDSGAAKRVADLVGRKSYFSSEDNGGGAGETGDSVCQVFSFLEDDSVPEE